MKRILKARAALLAGALLLGACDPSPTDSDPGFTSLAVFETTKGTFRAELYTEKAPITTDNFIGLVRSGFYDGLTFHRYEPNFVIQGGDPDGDGTGGSSQKIPLETDASLRHVRGALGMARTPDPNSATSQFYITLAPAHHLDGSYAVFGKVIEGMDVVEQLRVGDRMTRVTVP